MMKTLSIIFIVLAFAAGISAQEKSTAKWTRLESEDKKFAISFPPGFIVDTEKYGNRRYRICAFLGGVRMDLVLFKMTGAKDVLQFFRVSDNEIASRFSVNGFDGKRASASSISKPYSERMAIAYKDYYYSISVKAKSIEKPALKRFLFSIHLGGKQLFTQKDKTPVEEETAVLETLRTSPEVTEARSRKYEQNKINISYELTPFEIESDENNEKFSRPVVVVDQNYDDVKPPKVNGAPPTSGTFTTKIKINFLANGQIGDMIVYSGGDKEFAESCVSAARKIQFVPAQIDGKNADATAVVDYTFSYNTMP